jgi:adenine deaminase
MNVTETWIRGNRVYDRNGTNFRTEQPKLINNFNCLPIKKDQIKVKCTGPKMRIIEAYDGDLNTGQIIHSCSKEEIFTSNVSDDILKIVVKDRYNDSPPAVGFIRGFGIKSGAFGGSVAHDSHNIVCIGVDDQDITQCINEIISMKGGLAVTIAGITTSLQLEIAGIMSAGSCTEVAEAYEELTDRIKSAGCTLSAPFMTLSFMSLLVIPELKIGDRGLFNVNEFRPVSLFIE